MLYSHEICFLCILLNEPFLWNVKEWNQTPDHGSIYVLVAPQPAQQTQHASKHLQNYFCRRVIFGDQTGHEADDGASWSVVSVTSAASVASVASVVSVASVASVEKWREITPTYLSQRLPPFPFTIFVKKAFWGRRQWNKNKKSRFVKNNWFFLLMEQIDIEKRNWVDREN